MFTKNLAQPLLENEILKHATYISYILAKLSKPVKITKQTSLDFFYRGLFKN